MIFTIIFHNKRHTKCLLRDSIVNPSFAIMWLITSLLLYKNVLDALEYCIYVLKSVELRLSTDLENWFVGILYNWISKNLACHHDIKDINFIHK